MSFGVLLLVWIRLSTGYAVLFDNNVDGLHDVIGLDDDVLDYVVPGQGAEDLGVHVFPVITGSGGNFEQIDIPASEYVDLLRPKDIGVQEPSPSGPWQDYSADIYTNTFGSDDSEAATRPKRARNLDTDYAYALSDTIHHLRVRSGPVNDVVDLLVIVDNALYRRAMRRSRNDETKALLALRKYFSLIVSLIDFRYSQIKDSDLSIRVRLSGMFIAKDREQSPWAEYHVTRDPEYPDELVLEPNLGIKKLQEWLAQEVDNLPRHDHAMAFTGYTLLLKSGTETSGMAYIGTICQVQQGYSCSLVAEEGGFSSVGTAVHELGHSLGSGHDGVGENNACPASHNYVMAPINSVDDKVIHNYFRFSPCTIRNFKKLLRSEAANCLMDSRPSKTSGQNLPGSFITPDEQCRGVFGAESRLCPIEDKEEVCSRLWCIKPGPVEACVHRLTLAAVYGTPCGHNKICRQGRCVLQDESGDGERTASPPTRRPTSRRPDTQRAHCQADIGASYCRRIVPRQPSACDRSNIRHYCCFSCARIVRK